MFHWDAVDTNANLGGRNVLKTVEMAIWHDTRTTRTESERVFCRWIYLCIYLFYFFTFKNIFLALLRGRLWIRQWVQRLWSAHYGVM